MKSQNIDLFSHDLCEIDIVYRNKVKAADRPKVTCSRDVFEYFLSVWSHHIEHIEEFMIVCLNRANKILGWSKISQGGISGTVADPKVIFQIALKSNASSIILAHNHPSGSLKPSDADIKLTQKLKRAGESLDLDVLDHLIISSDAYYSFADEGML